MKRFFVLFLALSSFGCIKKAIEEKQEDLVVKAVTDGQWRVLWYECNGSYVNSPYLPYTFQFKTNNTVDAINNGTVEKTGTWSASAESKTITSNFSNTNSSALLLLNYTWTITGSTWTSVNARRVNGPGDTCRMYMEKL
jgi:hypothetical protein